MKNRHYTVLWGGVCVAYAALAIWFVVEFVTGTSVGVIGTAVLSSVVGLIALPLTLYSAYVVFVGIRHGRICTKFMAKEGARQIAKLIEIFSPDAIIFVAGNSEKLYNFYIAANLKSSYHTLALPSCPRYKQNPFSPAAVLTTNKFFIDVFLLGTLGPDDRLVIFDDVTKTGETVSILKTYLTSARRLPDQNIMTCGFIVDKFGYAKNSEPAFYYKKTEVRDDYAFPWRK